MRLIDADNTSKVFLKLMKLPGDYCGPSDIKISIDAVFSVLGHVPDADPVKHGHWINIDAKFENMYVAHQCSICKSEFLGDASNFCPRCGAKMDGEI